MVTGVKEQRDSFFFLFKNEMLHSRGKSWLLLHTGWTLYCASDVFGYSGWYLLKGQLSNALETQV